MAGRSNAEARRAAASPRPSDLEVAARRWAEAFEAFEAEARLAAAVLLDITIDLAFSGRSVRVCAGVGYWVLGLLVKRSTWEVGVPCFPPACWCLAPSSPPLLGSIEPLEEHARGTRSRNTLEDGESGLSALGFAGVLGRDDRPARRRD
ncbi:MAG: hypothetical protein ACRD0U_12650 [Acidimicrobiales bacterium]